MSNDNNGSITCIAGNVCNEFSYDTKGHLQYWQTSLCSAWGLEELYLSSNSGKNESMLRDA